MHSRCGPAEENASSSTQGEGAGSSAAHHVVALNAATGDLVWKNRLNSAEITGREVRLRRWEATSAMIPSKDPVAGLFKDRGLGDYLFVQPSTGEDREFEEASRAFGTASRIESPSRHENPPFTVLIGHTDDLDPRIVLRGANALIEDDNEQLRVGDFPDSVLVDDGSAGQALPESPYEWPDTDMHHSAAERVADVVDAYLDATGR